MKIIDDGKLKTSELLAEARKLFDVYCYDEKNLDAQFPAPTEPITSYFRDNQEPDLKHRKRSYDEYSTDGKKYMNLRQYLIAQMQYFKETKKHLDVDGWTRLSDLWVDGGLVYGRWDDVDSGLYLSNGGRGGRDARNGPREQLSLDAIHFNPSLEQRVSKIEEALRKHNFL